MAGLVNSTGNFLVVDQVNWTNVTVFIYESEEKYNAGLDPLFEKAVRGQQIRYQMDYGH